MPSRSRPPLPNPPKQSKSDAKDPEPPRTLWMGDLDPHWDEPYIQEIWSAAGYEVHCRLIRAKRDRLVPCTKRSDGNRRCDATTSSGSTTMTYVDPRVTPLHHAGYCFVEFVTQEDATHALALNTTVVPQPLRVTEESNDKDDKSDNNSDESNSPTKMKNQNPNDFPMGNPYYEATHRRVPDAPTSANANSNPAMHPPPNTLQYIPAAAMALGSQYAQTAQATQATPLAITNPTMAVEGPASNPNTRHFRLNWASGATLDSTVTPSAEYSLFVGDLAPATTEADLLVLFQHRFPSVRTARIMTDPVSGASRGFGFVRFAAERERDSAARHMDGAICCGSRVRCAPATPRNQAVAQAVAEAARRGPAWHQFPPHAGFNGTPPDKEGRPRQLLPVSGVSGPTNMQNAVVQEQQTRIGQVYGLHGQLEQTAYRQPPVPVPVQPLDSQQRRNINEPTPTVPENSLGPNHGDSLVRRQQTRDRAQAQQAVAIAAEEYRVAYEAAYCRGYPGTLLDMQAVQAAQAKLNMARWQLWQLDQVHASRRTMRLRPPTLPSVGFMPENGSWAHTGNAVAATGGALQGGPQEQFYHPAVTTDHQLPGIGSMTGGASTVETAPPRAPVPAPAPAPAPQPQRPIGIGLGIYHSDHSSTPQPAPLNPITGVPSPTLIPVDNPGIVARRRARLDPPPVRRRGAYPPETLESAARDLTEQRTAQLPAYHGGATSVYGAEVAALAANASSALEAATILAQGARARSASSTVVATSASATSTKEVSPLAPTNTGKAPEVTTVFVGGLAKGAESHMLRGLFSPFGMVLAVTIPASRPNCAFVRFANRVDAEAAMMGLQGYSLCGQPMRLSWGTVETQIQVPRSAARDVSQLRVHRVDQEAESPGQAGQPPPINSDLMRAIDQL